MRVILAVLFSVVLPFAAAAQSTDLFSMESRQDGRMWEAVGRLELGGRAFCTGSLIEPNLVLTAAHCLYDEAGARLPPEDIQFLAGWRNGRAAAYRRVRRAVAHPQYTFGAEPSSMRVYYDLALIELQHPINTGAIVPFATDTRPEPGDRVAVVSYAHNRSEAPSMQDTCDVMSAQDEVLVMSCSVDFGSSGSPVFFFDGGAPRIVSVVSSKAKSGDMPVSLGAPLDRQIATIQTMLRNGAGFREGSVFRPVRTQDEGRTNTGAKFIRP